MGQGTKLLGFLFILMETLFFSNQGDGIVKRREEQRRSVSRNKPSKTLFVVNFDPERTTERDLENHFEPFGKLAKVQMKKNFAFVQFESLDDAEEALEKLHERFVFPSLKEKCYFCC